MLGFPLAVWAAFGAPFTPDIPALRGFNFRGGITVSPNMRRCCSASSPTRPASSRRSCAPASSQ
jgi:ABC-type amino acid transport system permease subunit